MASRRFTAVAELVERTRDPVAAVRAQATHLLGYLGGRGKRFVGRLLDLLDDADNEVIEAALDAIARLKCHGPQVVHRLAACAQGHPATPLGDRAGELLRNMGHSNELVDGIDLSHAMGTYFEIDGRLCSCDLVVHAVAGRVLIPYHRILRTARGWKTDEDEVGMACLTPGQAPILTMCKLPLLLPAQATGGAGAKRVFKLRATLAAGLLCSLQVPFSDGRGWGDDNYAYLFDPTSGTWSRASAAPQAGFQLTALSEPAEPENPAHAVCNGELVVCPSGDGIVFACDATPYHLDDWQHAPETEALLQAQSAFLAQQRIGVCEITTATQQRWVFQPINGASIVLRFPRQCVSEHDRRQKATSVTSVEPLAAVLCGSQLVLALRIERRNGAEVDAMAVVEIGPRNS